MEASVSYSASHWGPPLKSGIAVDRLIAEEPLAVRVEGKPYVVVMRTPGDEIAHAAGLLLAEGWVDRPEDFATLGVCEAENSNVVTATLAPERHWIIPDKLDQREYISQTSCGICGKEVVSDLYQEIHPLSDDTVFEIEQAWRCLDALSGQQPLRRQTRAAHAAAIYDTELTCLCVAEDVGRHNALDKAVGKLFLDQRLASAKLLVLSSRISFELVQKAARAKIPVILAYSRPTSLAVQLANRLNMTLACSDGAAGLYLFCGEQRLKH